MILFGIFPKPCNEILTSVQNAAVDHVRTDAGFSKKIVFKL